MRHAILTAVVSVFLVTACHAQNAQNELNQAWQTFHTERLSFIATWNDYTQTVDFYYNAVKPQFQAIGSPVGPISFAINDGNGWANEAYADLLVCHDPDPMKYALLYQAKAKLEDAEFHLENGFTTGCLNLIAEAEDMLDTVHDEIAEAKPKIVSSGEAFEYAFQLIQQY